MLVFINLKDKQWLTIWREIGWLEERARKESFAYYFIPLKFWTIWIYYLFRKVSEKLQIHNPNAVSDPPHTRESHDVWQWAGNWPKDSTVHVTVIRVHLSGGQKPITATYPSLQLQLSLLAFFFIFSHSSFDSLN